MRYAVYWCPGVDSPLWQAGCCWLGRDAAAGEPVMPPAIPGVSGARFAVLTHEAARYGFHATIKAPFTLRDGVSETRLLTALADWAEGRAPFRLELVPALLSGFPVLRPREVPDALPRMTGELVRTLHPMAAPLDEADLKRRAGLSAVEQEALRQWGYPWVFDDYRFHLTLAAQPAGEEETACLLEAALSHFGTTIPVEIGHLALFRESARGAPFQWMASVGLGGKS